MDYPIILPAAPGDYVPKKLEGRAILRIDANGTASTVVEREDTSYSHPILNLAAWAIEYGPLRAVDADPEPDPDDPANLAEWERELLGLPPVAEEIETPAVIEDSTETITVAETTPEEIAA
ncbi:hypothetical protein PBI_FLOOF_34 [Microbacterium phage Floof]|uniref:Uncharacterized protein n=1 Tax=Microbacterium phage Floof TaxID=2201433 RepID=A0A2Z4Q4A1_9CAUD|nr:hypothetical protein PBI_FLOOF_34 [Microbacterium phage Floof]